NATIGTAIDATVSTAIDATIGTAIDATINATIGTAIDATVSTAIDTAVSTAIDATVSTAVNATIGTAIDATVDTAVSTATANVSAADRVLLALAHLDVDVNDAGVDTDLQRLRRTGSGQRGTRGDHRTSGYPRDANARLLRHVLLPPVADLVIGAAICGPWPCGESLSARPRRVVVTPPAPRFTPVPDIRMLL
ncbi:hypothetical protein, partial [Streptomyces sp. B226SN101]|uniref:hypothetical protein n=1 Tax=Streptomyces sp. B226SN101 TaxID=1736043 RepID=UPI0027E481AC